MEYDTLMGAKKVVIVEDDELLNRALCKAFANAGYEAQGFGDRKSVV